MIHNKNEEIRQNDGLNTTIITTSCSTASTATTIAPTTSSQQYISTRKDESATGKRNEMNPNHNDMIIPSSCQDLKDIGYSLNGFYSVKSQKAKNKIDTVFCNFSNNNQATAESKNIFFKFNIGW